MQRLLHTEAFTHRRFYTQTLLHTYAFTLLTLLRTDAFTQTLSHAETVTHRRFYTQTLLHTDTFKHRRFLHRSFCAQTLLHTDTFTFTHRHFYTEAFAHRRFYTQTLSHTDAFTHKHFYAQRPDPWNRNFTAVFGDRTSFRAQTLRRTRCNSQFYFSFWRSNLISCGKVAPHALQLAILLQFLAIEPHFVRKRCAGRVATRNFTSVFGDRTSFRTERLRRTHCNSQFYFSFWRSNLISCETVAPDALQLAILLQFLAIEPHFVRKGCAGRVATRNFTSVFGDRTSFRAKGLRPAALQLSILYQFLAIERHFVRKGCVSCRLVGIAPRLQERIQKKERARGQERKRAREQKGKMWGRMWGCEDEKMWRCEDVKMRRCFTDPHC